MHTYDIIYATTCRDIPGYCDVTYCDGTVDTIPERIGLLYQELNRASNRGRYFMIGRSALICENNIIQINPSREELVLGFDDLSIRHRVLTFSDYLLREFRNNLI
jgi:hypothetical protein